MLVGFNTNISYKNKTFHVQTEDGGPGNPVVVTLLYYQGAILASKKTGYSEVLSDPDCYTKVAKLMKVQHKGVIRELLAGKYTENIGLEQEKKSEEKPDESESIKIIKETSNEESLLENVDKSIRERIDKEVLLTEDKQAKNGSEKQEGLKGKKYQLTNGLDDILLNFIMKRTK